MDMNDLTSGIGPVWGEEGPSILKAVFSNACGFFKVDLTADLMLTPMMEIVNGVGISINDELGYPEENCTYSFVISESLRKGHILSDPARYAHEADRETLLQSYENGRSVVTVEFFVLMPVLGERYHRFMYFLYSDAGTGHILATVALFDISDTVIDQQQAEFARAMLDDYAFMFFVDTDSDTVRCIAHQSANVNPAFLREMSYRRFVEMSAEYFCDDDRVAFNGLMTRNRVLSLLEHEPQQLFIARLHRGDTLNEEYYQFQLVRSASWNRNHAFYLAARNINEEECTRRERDNMITALSADYEAVFAIDLDMDRFRVIRARSRFTRHHASLRDEMSYNSFLAIAGEEVYEEDRVRLLYAIQPDSIRAILQDKESAYVNYRRLIHGKVYFYKLKLIRTSGWETHGSCLIGIRNADRDTRLEMERIKALRMANTDDLTGLLNRTAFRKEVTEFIAENSSIHTAMVFLDVDHFKDINDNLGHAAGDAALSHVGEILKTAFRVEDPVGRIGGDEFLVFVRQTRRLDLETRLNKLLQDVHFTCKSDEGEEIQLSVSIGCVICEHESMTCDEMTEAADKLMYDAKSAGRDRLFIRTV